MALQQAKLKQKPHILPSVPSKNNNPTAGKGIILKYLQFCNQYLNRLKIAIDSDYDYLLDRRNFNIQNHILQTYTYSIENYFCYVPSLENLCIESTQSNKQAVFDFDKFLTEYSKIIYPIFIISLLYEQNKTQFNKTTFYSISDFCDDGFIDFQKIKMEDIIGSLVNLEKKVKNQVNTLKPNFINEDFEEMKSNIEAKGATEENCYLFIQGHFLLERLLSPIIKNITNQLSKEVGTIFTDNEEKNNYFSNLKSSSDTLKSNYNFIDCTMFSKVKADIAELKLVMQ